MNLELKSNPYLLRLYYRKLIEIFDAINSGHVLIPDDAQLNYYYTHLIKFTNKLLNEEGLVNLKKEAPQLYESLIGSVKNIDLSWEFLREDMLGFLGKIEGEVIALNIPNFPLPNQVTDFIKQVDNAISEHRKIIREESIKLAKRAKEDSVVKKPNRLIYKDNNGDYFYDDKRILMGQGSDYYKVFDILVTQADQNGFISYEDMEIELVKRDLTESKDVEARNKRINNAIINKKQGLFWLAKVNGKRLKNKTPDGKKLVEPIRGEGLKLNNPTI